MLQISTFLCAIYFRFIVKNMVLRSYYTIYATKRDTENKLFIVGSIEIPHVD